MVQQIFPRARWNSLPPPAQETSVLDITKSNSI